MTTDVTDKQDRLPNPQPAEPGQVAALPDDAEMAPLEDAPAGSDGKLPPGDAGGWPYLPANVLDRLWQQAVNAGPTAMGRQVAFALAYSLQNGIVPDATLLPDAPAFLSAKEEGVLALAALAETFTPSQRSALLKDVEQLRDEAHRARALLLVAPQLSQEERRKYLPAAWNLINKLEDPLERARLLIVLLPLVRALSDGELPTGFMAEALDLASSIHNAEARLRALIALAPHLPSTVRTALLLAVLDTIDGLNQPEVQSAALVAMAPHMMAEVHHRTLTIAARVRDPGPRARALTILARYLPARLQPRLRAAALEAIATIANEDERAEALAAFAPHLEEMRDDADVFPVLLERALTIAINMNRRDAMAKALVGLQARLPRNLQGEALAAVNTIPDEHTRASLLAELAASLPPDMSVAALAVAYEIRQRDARFTALAALARNMPHKAAERTWLDALAVAVALPRQFERVLALAELIPHLPLELHRRALTDALNAARSISKENARGRALATLAPLLDEEQLANALADAFTLQQPLERASALTALVPHLPDGDPQRRVLQNALDEIEQIPVEFRRARALANLTPALPPDMIPDAHAVAMAIDDPYDRATTLIALLLRLDEKQRGRFMDDAWSAARDITDHYDRSNALAALWPLVLPDKQRAVLRAILDAVSQISDDYDRASGVTVFAPLLASSHTPSAIPQELQVLREAVLAIVRLDSSTLRANILGQVARGWAQLQPPAVAFALWCEALPQLSRRSVPHLLSDLAALSPVLHALGGETATREAAQAVAAARQW